MVSPLVIDFSTLSPNKLKENVKQSFLARNMPKWQKSIWMFISDWANDQLESIAVNTSGSTGQPKTITHSKEAMKASAIRTCKSLDIREGTTALLCLPANKIAGMMMIVRAVVNRMKLVCLEPTQHPLNNLPDNVIIDFAAFTPSQVYDICNDKTQLDVFSKLRNVILGGGEISEKLIDTIRPLSNNTYNSFGMTETISHIALRKITNPYSDKYFTTLDGVEVSQDERGCLVVTDRKLGITNLITNDIVTIHSSHTFEWHGRYDFIINTGGIKVKVEDLEKNLKLVVPYNYFISGTPHPKWGQQITLVIEADALNEIDMISITDSIGELHKTHQPKQIWLCSKFIYTENGKLNRNESLRYIKTKINV